jgi:phosphatidylserine/phosphatidylglycerophosphate/cardiolipin synthase-like enzyme
MRSPLVKSPKGLEARGIAGTYVVLLAFNCPKAYCQGLLGFGIQRRDHFNGEVIWLRGLKKFDLPQSDAGDDATTRQHPIQKFHWGDYTTKPGRQYTYTIHAMKGQPGALVDFESVDVVVTCEAPDVVGKNGHAVHFNRSAAASQAFARRFPNMPPGDVEDPAARVWLSRGLEESLIGFIDGTQAGEGLHLFVYEFEKEAFLEALKRAKTRGVRLEILYDAIIKSNKGPSKHSKPLIKHFGLESVAKGRNGKGINISHNKFMVRTGKNKKPTAVWTGSTNFTDSGIYGQSNVGHAITGPRPAQAYFDWHQKLWGAPDTSAEDTRKIVEQLTAIPAANLSGTAPVFSPRTDIAAIKECARLVSGPNLRLVCFTAPFAMHDDLEKALAAAPAQVFGLLNKESGVGKAMHDAPNTQLAAAGAINQKSILEAWQKKLLKESMQHSGVFIHTKFILVDPLSGNPVVVSGSANFSDNSSRKNDENQLYIAGETEVADVYLGEFMRMFDHYYFRDYMKIVAKQKKQNPKAGFLEETGKWADRYFAGGEREAMRLAFF